MSNAIMTGIFNNYLTTYSPVKGSARLDNHKKSELKNIYDSIVKMNKEAPLYLPDRSTETKSFALSLKENARQLQKTILDTAGDAKQNFLNKQVAFSSNENVLSAQYIGEPLSDDVQVPEYEIQVTALASPQINIGYSFAAAERSLAPGNYSFDVNTRDMGYEFQFSVQEEDSNQTILNKLARLFNHANIGLNASVLEGPDSTVGLRISSVKTGTENGDRTPLFTISDSSGSSLRPVEELGIDYISSYPANAEFMVNGTESVASSNHFTIEKTFEVTLNGVTGEDGEPVQIGIKPNTESLRDNIRTLIGGFNSFLQAADNFQSNKANSAKLTREIRDISRLYTNELDSLGITATADGSLSIDEELLSQAADAEDASELFSPLMEFSSSLFNKSEQISRDPLNYANKTMVAYKNPGKNFVSPYSTSSYSGLFFNFYC